MNKRILSKYGILTLGLMILPLLSPAQENEVATVSYFSNALFNTLLVTILVLAILIVALSSVMKNITNSEMFNAKLRKRAEQNKSKTTAAGLVLLLSFASASASAAGTVAPASDRIGGVDQFTFYTMVSLIILELVFIGTMLYTMSSFIKADAVETVAEGVKRPKEKTILDKFISDAVDVEDENSVMLDHDYDGIKELDNNLPPWWKYGFYATIVVAFVYMVNYHVTGTSPLQKEEYKLAMKQAEAELAEYRKNSANNVDETTVKVLSATEDLSAGKNIFMNSCSVCHGKLGEGGAGPNLTDAYWIHGGSIKDIFKTIKYGYPEKAMKSWKDEYSPMQIAQVASFVKTLVGTNPPNPKEKQGELYVEEAAAPADSAAVKTDSLKVAVSDTLKTK